MRMLRRALEGEAQAAPEVQTIEMKGPLSEVFTQALNAAYAKDQPAPEPQSDGRQVVLESAQMDMALMRKLSEAVSATKKPDLPSDQTVYAVGKDAVTDDVVVDVTTELANMPADSDFVLIIDAVNNNACTPVNTPTERVVNLAQALECMVTAHGGKVYSSLGEYVASFK